MCCFFFLDEMEPDFSQIFVNGQQTDLFSADRSLHSDSTCLELLYGYREGSNGQSPTAVSDLVTFQNYHGVCNTNNSNTICITPMYTDSNSKLLEEDSFGSFGNLLDNAETFQTLGSNDIVPPWDDYPMQMLSPTPPLFGTQQQSLEMMPCKSEDAFDPTLSELNATINFDDIENIIFGDLPFKSASPDAVVIAATSPVASKPIRASPCLQQLLYKDVPTKDAFAMGNIDASPVEQQQTVDLQSPSSSSQFMASEVKPHQISKKSKVHKVSSPGMFDCAIFLRYCKLFLCS